MYSYIPHLNLYPVITYNFMRSHCCSTSSTCSRCQLEFYFTMNIQKQHLDKQFVQCTCIAWIYHHCMNRHETLFSWVWMAFYLDGTQLLTDDNDTVVGSHKNHDTKKIVSVYFISLLVSTSCKQDSSQPVVVVADHICCCSSSQFDQHHHTCFAWRLCVKGVAKNGFMYQCDTISLLYSN